MTDETARDAEQRSAAERLAAEIKRLRNEAGVSYTKLAIKTGYSRPYVTNAERVGKGVPSKELVQSIDNALHADGALIALRDEAERERLLRRLPMFKAIADDASRDGPALDLDTRIDALVELKVISGRDLERMSQITGNIVDLSLQLSIDIAADGWAQVSYRHEILNLTAKPFTRLARELWFENTRGRLEITPEDVNQKYRIGIQRVHDTANLAKFACQIFPAVQPGDFATIAYTCEGGQFVDNHYWRESVRRPTRNFSLNLRHRGGRRIVNCTANEEHPDGSERSASEDLLWAFDGEDPVIRLERAHLDPNYFVTLRWEITR